MPLNLESYSGEDREWVYNSLDCSYTRIVGEAETKYLEQSGLQEVDAFQHRLFPAVLQAMIRGVRIDVEERERLRVYLGEEKAKRESWLEKVLGHPLNPRSSKQMQALFYEDFRLPIVWKKDKEGKKVPTLGKNALTILSRKEPIVRPIINCVREVRSIGVLKSSFIEAPLDADSRMRCAYNVCGTVSYRFSSHKNAFGSGTNMANIPKGESLADLEEGEDDEDDGAGLDLPNVKTLFIPDEDKTWFDLDLSKADLHIVVWESDEREMKAMLAEKRDPYVETAREYYNDPTITKTRGDGSPNPKYATFKSFSHGTHYLATASGLAQKLGLTVREAERAQSWYLGKYPRIKEWQGRFIEEIKRTRTVSNKFGFRRYFFDRIDDSVFRQAIAWLPQSTVAILINKIWVNIFEQLPSVEVLMQVHDSLDGQFPTHQTNIHLEDIKRCARVVIPYDDPLIIPIGVKTSTKSWGDCE